MALESGGHPIGVSASFGRAVRRRRLALDLTQAALARRVGCSTATVKKIEHDERRPSRTMATRLAAALEVPPSQREAFTAVAIGELAARNLTPPGRSDPSFPDEDFVGRQDEIAALQHHLEVVLGGEARCVFVSGEVGQGKTALLRAFARKALAEEPDLVVAWGLGTAANGAGDPYLPFRDVLGSLLRGPVAPLVAAAIRAFGPQLIGSLVSATAVGVNPTPTAPPRDQLMMQVTDVLAAVAEQQPVLVLLDDLQWVDAASLELLFHLRRRLGQARVLVVGAHRASETAASSTPAAATLRRLTGDAEVDDAVIDLADVDDAPARRLCDALIDREHPRLDEDTRTRIFLQTRGHPLFVTELLRSLGARGDLFRGVDGAWCARADLDWDQVPRRIAAVIGQRLEALEDDDRRILEAAAVEGEHFTAEVVAAVLERDLVEVGRVLDRHLGDVHGLVVPAGVDRVGDRQLTRHRFAHALFQQYLHDGLGDGERRHLHTRVAVTLEALHEADLTSMLATIAGHHAAGDNTGAAVDWALRAGDRARVLYAHAEAVLHYERAAVLLRAGGDRQRLARVLMKLALSHQIGFDHSRAQGAYDEAFRLWRQPGGPQAEAAATLRLPWREPTSLDPTVGGYDMAAPLATQLFSGLVSWGEDNEVLPDVARRWRIENDGRRLVFDLRDDVLWHDGHRLTAHDFAFTYRRAVAPTTGARVARSLLEPVVGARQIMEGGDDRFGVEAPDDLTLIIDLVEPTSWFLPNLAYYVLLPTPRHVVEEHGPGWADEGHLVGNGPFRLDEWAHGERIVLERWAGWHGPRDGNVDRIDLDLALDAADAASSYDQDRLDAVSSFTTPRSVLATIRDRYPAELRRSAAFLTCFAAFALEKDHLADRRVRRAMTMAIDREAFCREALFGMGLPSSGGLVPDGMPGHQPGIGLHHDPQQATALLREADAIGDMVRVVVAAGRDREASAAFLVQSWREVGLDAEVVVGPTPTSDGTPDVEIGIWWADYPDPDSFLRVMVDEDTLDAWGEPRYRMLLDKAAAMTVQQDRLAVLAEAERLLIDEAVVLPLAYLPHDVALKPWVSGFRVPAVKHPGFWHDLTVVPPPRGRPPSF